MSRIDTLNDHQLEQVRVRLVDAIDHVNMARSYGRTKQQDTHLAYALESVRWAHSVLEVPSVLSAVREWEDIQKRRADLYRADL